MSIDERISEALRRLSLGLSTMRIPADPCDPDIVLASVRDELDALRARVAELERVQDAAFRDAHRAEADAARLREALGDVRPLVESLRDGVEDMHWYSARDAMLSALRAIDAALSAYAEVES